MKLNILYLINKSKVNKRGVCPINCRLTFNITKKHFSTGLFVNPKYWNSKKQKVLDDTEQSDYLNTQLSLIINKINQAFLLLQIQEDNFDVVDVYSIYTGKHLPKETMVVEYFDKFLIKIKRLVGIEIKLATLYKYEKVCDHVADFILWKYHKKDILLTAIKASFLDDLSYYLKVEKHHQQVTVNKVLQRFKRVVKEALSEQIIDYNPFLLHKPKKVLKKVVFLSPEELELLKEYEFSQLRLQLVKDLFIFCCYTGLAYNELERFSKKHIVKGFDGQLWIEMIREKTQKEIAVPILSIALDIINEYNKEEGEFVFPVLSNQRYNSYLKEIAAILGIEKRLTTHTARKTFASTVLLYNDVPIEIVSKLLGHSSIAITEASYGKVIKKKVSDEVLRLNGRFNST